MIIWYNIKLEVFGMEKKYSILLIVVILITLIVGCKQGAKEPATIKFCFRDGIPALTLAKLIKDNPTIAGNSNIDFEIQKRQIY